MPLWKVIIVTEAFLFFSPRRTIAKKKAPDKTSGAFLHVAATGLRVVGYGAFDTSAAWGPF